LRTREDDFVILDFEGEPQRTIEERRRKTSPLKDVAGMLRSFGYARGTATAWLSEDQGTLHSDLIAWERQIRATFLAAYAERVSAGGGAFLPESTDDLRAAVAAWELDKATYEVLYELNNRPDWLWIPLSAMIKHGSPSES
jgi:maltose alpha-D-glucosyltransferase/alpha-amylase